MLAKRPGDIRSMKNRSLAADMLGQLAMRRGDLAMAAQHMARAEQAGEDIVRFNPGDLGSWQYWVRAIAQSAEVMLQQGRVSDAIAKLQSAAALADDDRLTSSLAPMLEDVWYRLAELQMDQGQSAAAERSFADGVKATEEAAAQFPADSPRRVLAMTRVPAERALLSLRSGRYAAALDQSSATVKRLDDLGAASAGADATIERRISIGALHGLLETVFTSALHAGKFDVAEAAARRHGELPTGGTSDSGLHKALRQVEIARALVGQGKRAEAQAALQPALDLIRERTSSGTVGTALRRSYAEALYVEASVQGGDPDGRKARRRALDEASAVLVGVSAEARQLRSMRQLSEEIAAAQATP